MTRSTPPRQEIGPEKERNEKTVKSALSAMAQELQKEGNRLEREVSKNPSAQVEEHLAADRENRLQEKLLALDVQPDSPDNPYRAA